MKNDKSKNVQFIRPINKIKSKVGKGGLPPEVVDNAQKIVDEYVKDFPTIAESDLKKISNALKSLEDDKDGIDHDKAIYIIHGAAVDLKSNSGMFNKKLIEKLAINLANFTEGLTTFDADTKEIILAHYNGIRVLTANFDNEAIIRQGDVMLQELASLVRRYYKKTQVNNNI